MLALAACAKGPIVPIATGDPSASWMMRAIDPKSDIVITADLRALLADESFGPATRRAMRAAADRSVPSVNLKDAIEGARRALIALLSDRTILLILTDVPPIDPTSITGLDATWQWKPVSDPPPGVLELGFVPEAGSLFVLADHTWVLGAGSAAQRARASLLAAGGHPIAEITSGAPASIVVPGSRMGLVTRRLHRLHRILGGVVMLRASLAIGEQPTLAVEIEYDEEGSAIRAARTMHELFVELDRNQGDSLAFLAGGRTRSIGDRTIRLEAALPATLLDALSRAEDGLF